MLRDVKPSINLTSIFIHIFPSIHFWDWEYSIIWRATYNGLSIMIKNIGFPSSNLSFVNFYAFPYQQSTAIAFK